MLTAVLFMGVGATPSSAQKRTEVYIERNADDPFAGSVTVLDSCSRLERRLIMQNIKRDGATVRKGHYLGGGSCVLLLGTRTYNKAWGYRIESTDELRRKYRRITSEGIEMVFNLSVADYIIKTGNSHVK